MKHPIKILCGVIQTMTESATHVLYVREKCPGSTACLTLIEASPVLESAVKIEFIDEIIRHKQPLPVWLDGSPSLVNKASRSVVYGSTARDALRKMQGGAGGSGKVVVFSSASEPETDEVYDGGFDIELEEGDSQRPKLDEQALKAAMARRTARTKELQQDIPPTLVQ